MPEEANSKKARVQYSNKTIYDEITLAEEKELYYTSTEIEELINENMKGVSFQGLPLRTRSKASKEKVCDALGYPIPNAFVKTQPRFPGQNLDTYVQKSNNLQIWNEELDPQRRYLLIRLNNKDEVVCAKVVLGINLAALDTTGTLTQKYQARLDPGDEVTELISLCDTELIRENVDLSSSPDLSTSSPIGYPDIDHLLPIQEIYARLKGLIGQKFRDVGADQERNRGAELHKLVCSSLGYKNFADDGQFPDVKHQLLEVKLQTSPTIDLGLVCPDSALTLDIPALNDYKVKHQDVRYALFYGVIESGFVKLTNLYLTTGESFFNRFPRFGGKVLNKKLQIPLPEGFFDEQNDEDELISF